MADRPTSVAKSVEGLHHEESALDRARALREQFAHAQEQNNQKQKERQAERPHAEGSKMVKEDAPVLKPDAERPHAPDVRPQAAAAKLGKEHDNAGSKMEAARKAQEAFKARQQQIHDNERDRER